MAGALELHACYTKYGLALEDFEGERYQRLAHLKSLLAAGILDRSLRRLPQSYERMSDAAGFVPAFRDAQAVDIQQAE